MGVTPEEVLNSHLIVLAAEESRKSGVTVDFPEYKLKAFAG